MASLTIVALLNAFTFASATEFLKGAPKDLHERLSADEVRSSLLNEIERTMGSGSASHRLDKIEAQLKPIFMSLPKNSHGNLDHSAGRYALHRLFVLRHGWSIKGIDSKGGAWNTASPTEVLKDQVPAYVQDLFEERLGGQGLGLHELAILASTMEHLIHKETSSKLGDAFKVHDLPLTAKLDEASADDVLDTYVMAYIIGENLANMSLVEAQSTKSQMPDMFIAWRNTQKFVRGIRADLAKQSVIDFETMTSIADAVGEQFGSFFSTQCSIMKDKLMSMGDGGRGRVTLTDFYRSHLNGSWQFQESVSYLRQLGVLDESEPTALSIVIPNYVYSQTNCIPSGFYSICCKDECAGLLGHLEERLARPEATPEAIAEIVKDLASSTAPALGKISSTLSERLEEIASTNGGLVPLHGRLFAQWLHHAYPRECPFPHVRGTTSQQAPDEWLIESGSDPLASREEMIRIGSASNETHNVQEISVAKAMPWSPEEELIVCTAANSHLEKGSTQSKLRALVFLGAILSVTFGMVQSLKGMPTGVPQNKVLV